MTAHRSLYGYIALLFTLCLYAQQGWQALPNAPVSPTRFEDIYFVDAMNGWVAGRTEVDGSFVSAVYRTRDGGDHWELLITESNAFFRSIAFVDTLNGWMGLLDTGIWAGGFFETRDGGRSWTEVDPSPQPSPVGICAIRILNENNIFASGQWSSDAAILKSTDRGLTWKFLDLRTVAQGVVDTYFMSPTEGIAVGMTPRPEVQAMILRTTDGGITWEERARSSLLSEWAWKASFPTPTVGYVSIETTFNDHRCFKTVDGGVTWEEIFVTGQSSKGQGIGFIDAHTGWIGFENDTYGTRDGGWTWEPAGFGKRINRFRILSDTLGYAVGETVYKFSGKIVGTADKPSPAIPGAFQLQQNFPNPFNGVTLIRYAIPEAASITVTIYDPLGRSIRTLIDEHQSPGEHQLVFDAADLASGIYYYQLKVVSASRVFNQTRKLLLIK